ncbi:MAG TPA: HTH domain-containing protein [candidate division Zixibacteria bacterium]|nr:HTH domain-containing protein [candidate division Zixibacteria bacterium]
MKQHEAVIKVMEENGGFATFKHLYENVLNVKGPEWKTKTPYASIRRIVQDGRFFFRIRPGLWALRTLQKQVLSKFGIEDSKDRKSQDRFSHYYFQGLLVELGNLEGHKTTVPAQDKNRYFLSRKLSELTTLESMPNFTFDNLLRFARTVDVVWFNKRLLPHSMFEIEISTDFINSFNKFVELQDFNVQFNFVADKMRKREFDQKSELTAYKDIYGRVNFMDIEKVVKWHQNAFEFKIIMEG